MTLVWFLLFLTLLFVIPALSLLGFLAMEYVSLADSTDRLQTYSQYVKKWIRRTGLKAVILTLGGLALFWIAATLLTVYLAGHFVWEAW